MAHHRTPDVMARPAVTDPSPRFSSLLSAEPAEQAGGAEAGEPAFFSDLRLDQVIEAVAGEREERELVAGLLRQQVRDIGTLKYRHEVFADLEDAVLFEAARTFTSQMRQVRARLGQLARMRSAHQRAGWFLDAAVIYCDAVRSLAANLASALPAGRGEGLPGHVPGLAEHEPCRRAHP